jgi:hypothetical protein
VLLGISRRTVRGLIPTTTGQARPGASVHARARALIAGSGRPGTTGDERAAAQAWLEWAAAQKTAQPAGQADRRVVSWRAGVRLGALIHQRLNRALSDPQRSPMRGTGRRSISLLTPPRLTVAVTARAALWCLGTASSPSAVTSSQSCKHS